jgi:hypothetical protein
VPIEFLRFVDGHSLRIFGKNGKMNSSKGFETAFTHLRQNAPCGSTGMNGVVTRHSLGEGGLLLRRVPPF